MNVTPPALEPAAPSSSTPTDVTGRVPVTQVPQLGDPSPASQPHASTLPLAGKDSESLLVAAARSSLRGGRTREALALLERLRAEQPHGELAQEREALTIEALRALGQTQAARGRASVFLERYPRSPHAATVRRALE